tara:strand:- start:458 stop:661 length:204 start_codon:yes stop_codon:yes gene_type:complete
MIPVEGFGNLYRDESTNAIINTDKIGYENYIANRRFNSNKKAELDSMKNEIETLKSLLHELSSKITS